MILWIEKGKCAMLSLHKVMGFLFFFIIIIIAFFTYHTQFMYNVKNVAREHLKASTADNGASLVEGETDNSTGGAARESKSGTLWIPARGAAWSNILQQREVPSCTFYLSTLSICLHQLDNSLWT